MEIRKLIEVEQIANELFPCRVKPIHETHAKGYRGIKLIVGWKRNEAYDPSIDPDNLTEELKRSPELLANKMNPRKADIRIIWLPPGTSKEELITKWLIRIKDSLAKKEPIATPEDRTLTKIAETSDADLAADIASGKKSDSRFDEFEDGFEETEEDCFEEELDNKEDSNEVGESKEPLDAQSEPKSNAVIDALNQLSDNIGTLSNDLGELNNRIDKIDDRLNEVENKPDKKGKKKK